jgi:TPR repeat protein
MFDEGQGIEQSDVRAAFWYYQSAIQGYAQAQVRTFGFKIVNQGYDNNLAKRIL